LKAASADSLSEDATELAMLYAKGGTNGNDSSTVDYGRLIRRLELVEDGARWRDDLKRAEMDDKRGRTYDVKRFPTLDPPVCCPPPAHLTPLRSISGSEPIQRSW